MRTIGRLILAAVFLALTVFLAAAASFMPELFFSFYTDLSRQAMAFLSGVTASFPFPVWQPLLGLLVLLEIYGLVRVFTKKKGLICWAAGLVLLVSILLFVFTALWGVNHYAPPVSERVGLQVTEYSVSQLTETANYMAAQANHWAEQAQRDENGDVAVDFEALAEKAGDGYEKMAQINPFFADSGAPVKKLIWGDGFGYLGLTGIFVPYTGESGVSSATYGVSVPFTMCHEIAHRLTVAPEEEANFCAFLACLNSEDPAFQYSGWYSAFVYTYNALNEVDKTAAGTVWNSLSETVRRDCRRANDHYDRYEGEVQEAAEKVNDFYLKTFDEEAGVQSYGLVADLLVAWYQQYVA